MSPSDAHAALQPLLGKEVLLSKAGVLYIGQLLMAADQSCGYRYMVRIANGAILIFFANPDVAEVVTTQRVNDLPGILLRSEGRL